MKLLSNLPFLKGERKSIILSYKCASTAAIFFSKSEILNVKTRHEVSPKKQILDYLISNWIRD